METALSLVNVTLEYPDGDGTLKALDQVSLAVGAGDFLALVGPSGSGKSSLLAVASALIRPTSGVVTIDGQEAAGLRDSGLTAMRREKVGIFSSSPTSCRPCRQSTSSSWRTTCEGSR